MPIITYGLIGITTIISFLAFSNAELKQQFLFWPFGVKHNNEFQRFLTSAFIHADQQHLLFNMITLFFFGPLVENYLAAKLGGQTGRILFVLFYLVSAILSAVPSYFKHKNNKYYAALGASGATSAVLFAGIMIQPFEMINFIPAFIFGPAYLAYSVYMYKKGGDNIGHDAHFMGAIVGLVGIVLLVPETFQNFLQQIFNFF